MGQIQGSLQNIDIDVAGGTSFKTLVCLSTSSVNTTVDITTEQTNCGVLSNPAEPQMTIDFDAVCEVTPTGNQLTYKELLSAMVNKTLINIRFQNPAVSGASTGATYFHQFFGYVSDLSLSQSTTEFIKFSGTIQSTGGLDIIA